MIQTISSQLYEPVPFTDPLLKILLVVTVSNNGNYAFSKYSNERGDFFTVNPKSHITIRYTPKDVPWDQRQQVVITQRNIYQLRLGFKKFYRNFQRDDLYVYDELDRISEMITTDRDIVMIPLGMGQLLRLSPCIVSDKKNIQYPGVTFTLNNEENQVNLSVEEFEGIYDLFKHIDMYQAGLTLLQTYIGMRKISVETTISEVDKNKPPKTIERKTSGSIFSGGEEKEYVKSPPKMEIPKTLDDLM